MVESPPPLRVLVVDDDPLVGRLLRRAFDRLGVSADVVGDAADARRAVTTRPYALVLVDQRLGAEDGDALVRELRPLARGSTRWVCVSASVGPDEDHRAGFDGAAPKPATVEELREILARWLAPP